MHSVLRPAPGFVRGALAAVVLCAPLVAGAPS